MGFTPRTLVATGLIFAVFLQACAPKPFQAREPTNKDLPPTECSVAIINEAINLKREAILFPRQKSSYVAEGFRFQRAYNSPQLTDYYFEASEFGRRGEILKSKIIKTNCYVDKANEEMLGRNFEKLQEEIQRAMGPLIDFVNYPFYFDKQATNHGILAYKCDQSALSDPGLESESAKVEAFKRDDGGLFLKFSVASKIMQQLLSDYEDFELSLIDRLPENSEIKFQKLMAKALFFCTAINSLDGKGECVTKATNQQKLCDKAFEHAAKMGGSNER